MMNMQLSKEHIQQLATLMYRDIADYIESHPDEFSKQEESCDKNESRTHSAA